MSDELLIIQKTLNEGVGSVYERIILHRFLSNFCQKYQFQTVLEYPAPITKGLDNLAFLRQGKNVTVSDPNIQNLESLWSFDVKPNFLSALNHYDTAPYHSETKKYDLVWNFAQVQLDPSIVDTIISHSQKYILIFTPNVLNWGTPFHLGYHLLFGQECHHAERGGIKLRTKSGLISLLKSKGLKILESGYIDSPPIPDIGFSIRELKAKLRIKLDDDKANDNDSAADVKKIHSKIEKLGVFEYKAFPLKFFLSHHVFVLGEK